MFVDYYNGIFTSYWNCLVNEIFNAVKLRVPHYLQNGLVVPFTRDEIDIVVKNFRPPKSPGSDGMLALSYKKIYWSIVGDDVCSTCLSFLNHSGDVRAMNKTMILL